MWAVTTLCLVPWPCKRKRIATQEETDLCQDPQGMEAGPRLSTDEQETEAALLLGIVEQQKDMKENFEKLVSQIEQAVDEGCSAAELTVERESKEILPGWLKQRWPSCLSGQWKACLRFKVQPAITEDNGSDRHEGEELQNKLKDAIAWATDIHEKKQVTNCAFKVFYIYLPKGSPTGNTLEELAEELEQAIMPQKIIGTTKIVEVRHLPAANKWGLLMDLSFIVADVFTDVVQIANLCTDEFFLSSGILLMVFVSSLTAQICGGELLNLRQEFTDSLNKGFKTNGFLRIVDREKGFEGFVSLAISCNIVNFQIDPSSCMVSLVSIIFSSWGVATFLFRTVFLDHAVDALGSQGLGVTASMEV